MSELRLLNIKQTAERLGVSVNTLYAWVNQRKIPHYKIGGLLKFAVKDIEKWVAKQRVSEVDFDG